MGKVKDGFSLARAGFLDNPNGLETVSRSRGYGSQVVTDWVAVAASMGLAPGRCNASGWVSILCPDCRKRGGCDLDTRKTPGGFNCFKCGAKGHLSTRLERGGEALPSRPASCVPEPAAVSRLDVGAGLRALRAVQPRFASQLTSWGRGRGWPAELVALLPGLPGLLFVPDDLPRGVPSWAAWAAWPSRASSLGRRSSSGEASRRAEVEKHARTQAGAARGAGGDAGAELRRLLSPGRDPRPIWFVLSDGRDRAVSVSRRHAERGGGIKARTLKGEVAGELGAAGFGLLGAAVGAAKRGEVVFLCEGGPDWAALGALCLLDGQGAAVGARDAGSFVGRARDLRAALERAGVFGARIVICPHRGDDNDKGERVAGEAAAVLARVGSVAVARVPAQWLDAAGKGDASDVLERGGLDGLRSYLGEAVAWDAGSLPVEVARARLVEAVAACVERGGVRAVAANLGHGKSRAAKVAAVHHAAGGGPVRADLLGKVEGGGRVVLYAVPTLALAREAAGDLRALGEGVRVELWEGRHGGNCSRSDLSGAMAALVPGGAWEVCKGCGLYERGPNQCGFKRQEARLALQPGERGLVIVTTHARLVGHDLLDAKGQLTRSALPFAPSVVVVDEDASGSVLGELSVDLAGLAGLDAAGALDVDAETLQTLQRLIGGGGSFSLAPWADLLGPIRARDLEAYGNGVLASVTVTGDAARAKALEARGVAWQTPAALERASLTGWVGAFVHKGRLTLPWDAALPRGTHATIYLDATGDKVAAQAVLGPDAGWDDLRVAAPSSVRFVQIGGVSSSKGDLCGDGGRPRSARALALWLSARLRFDGPDVLHVTHKATADLLRGHVVGPVIHFEGGEARGSNAYEQCSRVVLDEWHVPTVAVEALAARLVARGAAPDDARASARRRLLQAPTEQAAGRVRYFNGAAREVVFLGEARGVEVDAEQDAAALLLDLCDAQRACVRACLGSVLGLGACEAAAALVPWGEAAALEVVRRVVAARGVWVPALETASDADGDGVESHSGERCNIYILQRSSSLLSMPTVTGSVGVSLAWLGECIKGLGGWEAAARLVGLRSALLDVGRGAPVVALHDGPLTRAGVVAAFAGRGVERVTFDGAGIWLGSSGGSRLRRAVGVLIERGEAVTAAAVASVAGVSVQSARAWARREPEFWASVAAPSSSSAPASCELVPVELVEVAEPVEGGGPGSLASSPPASSSPPAPSLVPSSSPPAPLPVEVAGPVEGCGVGQEEPARTQAGAWEGQGGGVVALDVQGGAAGPVEGCGASPPPASSPPALSSLGPVALPVLWRASDVWTLQDSLDPHSAAAHALRRLRGAPGPWPVGQVVRAVGLCAARRALLLRAGAGAVEAAA